MIRPTLSTRTESLIVALTLLSLTTCVVALIVVTLDGRTPARAARDATSSAIETTAEYLESCEREHRSWCRECREGRSER